MVFRAISLRLDARLIVYYIYNIGLLFTQGGQLSFLKVEGCDFFSIMTYQKLYMYNKTINCSRHKFKSFSVSDKSFKFDTTFLAHP